MATILTQQRFNPLIVLLFAFLGAVVGAAVTFAILR